MYMLQVVIYIKVHIYSMGKSFLTQFFLTDASIDTIVNNYLLIQKVMPFNIFCLDACF